MSSITPNEFSYKVFTSFKTEITEDELVEAIQTFKNFWDKPTLKRSIKKVGLTKKIQNALYFHKNPLTSNFSNSDDNAEYIRFTSTDIQNQYLTPEEYQFIHYRDSAHLFTARPYSKLNRYSLEMYLTIIKRHPKTTQSRILIKYLNKLLKE